MALPLLGVPVLLGALVAVLWRRRIGWRSAHLLLLSALTLWPLAWNFGIAPIAYPVSIEDMQTAASVRLPSDEPIQVFWGGDELGVNAHVASPPALGLRPGGAAVAHRLERAGDYGCYGTTVVAPATARVHHTRDGEPDAVPGQLTSRNFRRPRATSWRSSSTPKRSS